MYQPCNKSYFWATTWRKCSACGMQGDDTFDIQVIKPNISRLFEEINIKVTPYITKPS